MLYNTAGQQVQLNERATDNQRAQVREVLEPLPHKGNKLFRLEERARIVEKK
jgi:hypothetical protein